MNEGTNDEIVVDTELMHQTNGPGQPRPIIKVELSNYSQSRSVH